MQVQSVTQSTFKYLRDSIIVGIEPPGSRVDETRLAKELGVSRPPLREALRLLQHEQLVTAVPRKGTFVTDISIDDYLELFQVRLVIELSAIDFMQEKEMQTITQSLSSIYNESDFESRGYSSRHDRLKIAWDLLRFHIRLVDSTGNFRLSYFYKSIVSNIARYIYLFKPVPDRRAISIDEHKTIEELLRQKAYCPVKSLLREHITTYLEPEFLKDLEIRISDFRKAESNTTGVSMTGFKSRSSSQRDKLESD